MYKGLLFIVVKNTVHTPILSPSTFPSNLPSLSRSIKRVLCSGSCGLSGSSLVLDHLKSLDITVLVSCLDGSTVFNIRQEGCLRPLRRDLSEEQYPEPVRHVLRDISRYCRLQVLLYA